MRNPLPAPEKFIQFDHTKGDYACYLHGTLVGFAASYLEGDSILNMLIAEQAADAAVADADDAADMEDLAALVVEIVVDHTALVDYPDISEEEAVIVALGMRRALRAWADGWDDMRAQVWSAGCCVARWDAGARRTVGGE